MIGAVSVRNRFKRQKERSGVQSGGSDHESERVGSSRRKRKKRDCKHDPYAQELAQILMGAYYWLSKPVPIKPLLGNGLEGSAWGRFCAKEKSIFLGMLMFRLLNYFVVQTYYVPDEYWQSLEVAHHKVFGDGYITWEWTSQIRSYLYPAVFTFIYKFLELVHLDSAAMLIRAPRLAQSLLSATGDLYLYKLSSRISHPLVGQWTLLVNCLSWFIFYTATRTLSNTAEMSLITIALYYYPWTGQLYGRLGDTWKFLWIAALSMIVRPTATVLWFPLCICHVYSARKQIYSTMVLYIITGTLFLFISMRIDKSFYEEWTFVPLNFVTFNLGKKISHFYGVHPWHWYITQGLPFVLSTHLPVLIVAWKSCKNRMLQVLIVWTVFLYSMLAHKEQRFIMPVLPLIMHVIGYYITTVHQENSKPEDSKLSSISEQEITNQLKEVVGTPERDSGLTETEFSDSISDSEVVKAVHRRLHHRPAPWLTPRRIVYLLLLGNVPMMFYFSVLHQRGALEVTKYLAAESQHKPNMAALFLMPCHSTPYYSHIHTNITMRFLTCEPNLTNISDYVDEADRFYEDPVKWLKSEVTRGPNKRIYSHIVMFDSLENQVAGFLKAGKYSICSRHFHSHFITDSRQSKTIVTFCR